MVETWGDPRLRLWVSSVDEQGEGAMARWAEWELAWEGGTRGPRAGGGASGGWVRVMPPCQALTARVRAFTTAPWPGLLSWVFLELALG